MGCYLGKKCVDFCRGKLNKSGLHFNILALIATKKDALNEHPREFYLILGLITESSLSFMSVTYFRPRLI